MTGRECTRSDTCQFCDILTDDQWSEIEFRREDELLVQWARWDKKVLLDSELLSKVPIRLGIDPTTVTPAEQPIVATSARISPTPATGTSDSEPDSVFTDTDFDSERLLTIQSSLAYPSDSNSDLPSDFMSSQHSSGSLSRSMKHKKPAAKASKPTKVAAKKHHKPKASTGQVATTQGSAKLPNSFTEFESTRQSRSATKLDTSYETQRKRSHSGSPALRMTKPKLDLDATPAQGRVKVAKSRTLKLERQASPPPPLSQKRLPLPKSSSATKPPSRGRYLVGVDDSTGKKVRCYVQSDDSDDDTPLTVTRGRHQSTPTRRTDFDSPPRRSQSPSPSRDFMSSQSPVPTQKPLPLEYVVEDSAPESSSDEDEDAAGPYGDRPDSPQDLLSFIRCKAAEDPDWRVPFKDMITLMAEYSDASLIEMPQSAQEEFKNDDKSNVQFNALETMRSSLLPFKVLTEEFHKRDVQADKHKGHPWCKVFKSKEMVPSLKPYKAGDNKLPLEAAAKPNRAIPWLKPVPDKISIASNDVAFIESQGRAVARILNFLDAAEQLADAAVTLNLPRVIFLSLAQVRRTALKDLRKVASPLTFAMLMLRRDSVLEKSKALSVKATQQLRHAQVTEGSDLFPADVIEQIEERNGAEMLSKIQYQVLSGDKNRSSGGSGDKQRESYRHKPDYNR